MCNVFPTVDKINVSFHSLNIIAYLYKVGRILFIYKKKINKKGQEKQNKTNENYVQQTTIYNNHIDTQQVNSSGTAYLLMC